MVEGIRICPRCNELRADVDFPPRGRACLSCRRASVRLHYARNRQYYLDKARASPAARCRRESGLADRLPREHPCVDCGITDIRVLEFDHRDPTTKSVAVAVLARGATASRESRRRSRCATCAVRTATGSEPTPSAAGGGRTGPDATKITKRARQDSNLQPPDP